MPPQSFQAGWAAIDQTRDPTAYIRFMDRYRRGKSDSDPQQYRPIFALLAVQEGEMILDVGCGTGGAVRALASQVGDRGRVIGIDASAIMIAEAEKRAAGLTLPIDYRVADAHALPFADNSFDGCYAIGVFEILPDPRRALAEMVRVLRPGGRLVIPGPDADGSVIDAADRDVTRRFLHFMSDHEANGWIGRQLPGYAQELGLDAIQVVPLTGILTDFAFAYELWFRDSLARAQAAGALSAAEVIAWVADQEARQRAGRAFLTWAVFLLSARKPITDGLSLGMEQG
jgi:ubiquinone/menaquinone biosynthesis C-methylase UbiE